MAVHGLQFLPSSSISASGSQKGIMLQIWVVSAMRDHVQLVLPPPKMRTQTMKHGRGLHLRATLLIGGFCQGAYVRSRICNVFPTCTVTFNYYLNLFQFFFILIFLILSDLFQLKLSNDAMLTYKRLATHFVQKALSTLG